MELDGYALAYLFTLIATAAVGFGLGGCARAKGSLLLAVDWALVVTIQRWTHDLASPLMLAGLDFSFFLLFGLIGLIYNRHWAWVVSGTYVAALFTHLIFVVTGQVSTFGYLSTLAVLGYLRMAAIGVPPLFNLVTGGGRESLDYPAFMRGGRLPPSAFQTRKTKGGKE